LLEKRPGTINDLFAIRGLGPKKVEWFGEDIIELIKNPDQPKT
jgi:hypothetical protein